jgi:hypothetical protein
MSAEHSMLLPAAVVVMVSKGSEPQGPETALCT